MAHAVLAVERGLSESLKKEESEINPMACCAQAIGQIHAQAMRDKNRVINEVRDENIQLGTRLQQEMGRRVQLETQVATLEKQLHALQKEQEECSQAQRDKVAQIETLEEQVRALHCLDEQHIAQVRHLQAEVIALREREESLQRQMNAMQQRIVQEQTARVERESQYETRIATMQRTERERIEQNVQDANRYAQVLCDLRTCKEQYRREEKEKMFWANRINELRFVPWGWVIQEIALPWIFAPSAQQKSLCQKVEKIRGPFLELHQRLGNPPPDMAVFDLTAHILI